MGGDVGDGDGYGEPMARAMVMATIRIIVIILVMAMVTHDGRLMMGGDVGDNGYTMAIVVMIGA